MKLKCRWGAHLNSYPLDLLAEPPLDRGETGLAGFRNSIGGAMSLSGFNSCAISAVACWPKTGKFWPYTFLVMSMEL